MNVEMVWKYGDYKRTQFNYNIINEFLNEWRDIYPEFKKVTWSYIASFAFTKNGMKSEPKLYTIKIICSTEYMELFRSLLDITENVNAETNYSD